MIISASRRTDIPAFYSQWFMNRIRAGWCIVPNPLNPKQLTKVLLNPKAIDAIVFWSKNPAPLLPYLDELDQLGYKYYFQYTLNDYPLALEPNVPSLDDRLSVFIDLSHRLDPLRVVWRYDPIIISNFTPVDYHRDRFENIAEKLRGCTYRVMISIVDIYSKTERRLAQLEQEEDYSFDKDALNSDSVKNLLIDITSIARRNNMDIFSCAEENDYSSFGVAPGRCIDEQLINNITASNIKYKKDPSQRSYCLCMLSKDIGANDTCMHGCTYCYATRNCSLAERRFSEHDPYSPILWSKLGPSLNIVEKDNPQLKLL